MQPEGSLTQKDFEAFKGTELWLVPLGNDWVIIAKDWPHRVEFIFYLKEIEAVAITRKIGEEPSTNRPFHWYLWFPNYWCAWGCWERMKHEQYT